MPFKKLFCFMMVLSSVGLCETAAANNAAGQAAAFLRLPTGARPAGMGYAFTGVADDINALYFNPGGLYKIKGKQVDLMYSLMSFDRVHHKEAFVWGGEHGTLGMMLTGFSLSDIDGRDLAGNPTETFSTSDLAATLGYGYEVSPILGVGANLKYIHQSIQSSRATGYGLDMGLLLSVPVGSSKTNFWRLGLSVSNVGSTIVWDTLSEHKDRVPFTGRLGTSLDVDFDSYKLLGTFDVIQTKDETLEMRGGVEVWFNRIFALRVGLSPGAEQSFQRLNVGSSLRLNRFQIDYAYAPDFLETGATNILSLQSHF